MPTSNTLQPTSATKDLGRWRPTDDLMLISAVQQTNDLTAVYLGIKFSCRFTLKEIEERWHALLYNPQISHIAIEAMRGLHPGVVTMALNNALWSQEEEVVLAKIPSVSECVCMSNGMQKVLGRVIAFAKSIDWSSFLLAMHSFCVGVCCV